MADKLLFELKIAGSPLKFVSMEGTEEISRLFEYSLLTLAKPSETINFPDLLGKDAHVVVSPPVGDVRHYHALISGCSFEGVVGSNLSYRLTLRPWLWLLTRGTNVRIFQKMTVPDILKKVFTDYGGVFDVRLSGSFAKREYCVQYRESDFNFVSRLMEEEGICYFFEHAEGRHTLVLGNASAVFKPRQGLSQLPYRNAGGNEQAVRRWRFSEQIQTTKYTVRDHSFMAPTQTYEKVSSITRPHAKSKLDAYDYPAGLPAYPEESAVGNLGADAEAIAKRRIEELQSRYAVADGETDSTNLCVGASLKLTEHPVSTQNIEHVVLSTRITMRIAGYEAGVTEQAEHHCTFRAFASSVLFRPARLTPKPTVAGPQTAVVVGPAGEEIFVDKHGRVKLQFHWDRDGKKDADSSCFVRVAQPAAGKGWGMVFLPRIGQEVVVDFLEGDPDQPLVTGRVYNAENMPPYELPANKTVSTIKSRSSPQGGAEMFNELRFEDKKGSELFFIQAQKDKMEIVKETSNTEIRKDMLLTVKKDRKEKVEGEMHLSVTKLTNQEYADTLSVKVAKDVMIATDAKYNLKTAQDLTGESGTAYSIKAGTDLHAKAGKNVGIDGGMNVHIKGGMNVVIEGGMQLTLKAGAGSVVIGPDGVSITGPLVKINSGGGPGSGSGASPVAPAATKAATAPDAVTDPLKHS